MLYEKTITRSLTNEDSNDKILSAYDQMLMNEKKDATQAALGTLNAIIGMFKDNLKGSNKDILDMAKGIKKSYEKNKGFSKDQAQWIYKMSKAMFK
jgi:hypothetical protein